MGLPPFLVAESCKLFLAQRLVRRLCRLCRFPRPITAGEKALLAQHGYMEDQLPDSVFSAKGCPQCYYTGYQKRFAVVESLEMTAPLREAFTRGASRVELVDIARRNGFKSMYVSALGRVLLGDTSFEEIFSLQSMD
jgi:type II secretory ATPase GspE/PulE/Tfp pilus assembly ATPase PilB-like protein